MEAKPTEPLVGTTIGDGRYRLDEKRGQGGQATVFRGTHLLLEMPVAIKILRPPHGQEHAAIQRFLREGQRLAKLRHPNIVPVHDFGFDRSKGVYFLVSDYIPGTDLQELLRAHPGPTPRDVALRYMRQMADALQHAHAHDILHRDVKPSNVLIDERSGDAALCDFGLARMVVDEHLDVTRDVNAQALTPAYASPEQFLSEPIDPRSDIYSLGLIAYEMLVGKHPFREPNDTATSLAIKQVREPPPRPRSLNPELSRDVERVLLKAIAKRPEDRHRTAHEFAMALSSALVSAQKSGTEDAGAKNRGTFSMIRLGIELVMVGLLIYVVAIKPFLAKGDLDIQRTADSATPTLTWTISAVSVGTTATVSLSQVAATAAPSALPQHTATQLLPTHTHEPTIAFSSTTTRTTKPSPTSTRIVTPIPTATVTARPTFTRAQPTVTPTASPARIMAVTPLSTVADSDGHSAFPVYAVSDVRYQGGEILVYGQVHMPEARSSDQTWELRWAGDDVIGACGLPPTSNRIEWWPVGATNRKEGASGLLGGFPTKEMNCTIWLRLSVWTNNDKDTKYYKFNLMPLMGKLCENKLCPG